MSYQSEYQHAIEQPEGFWAGKAADIHWYKPPTEVITRDAQGCDRWFADGELNTCYLALDVHVEHGRGDQTALIYDSPVTGTERRYSYRELTIEVAHFAGVLSSLGVEKGDRVVIYMPMIPEAVIGMLACARLGAIHSVVFGGFAAQELAVRIDDAEPKVILSASCGIEGKKIIPYKPILDDAIDLSDHKPQHCIIFQRQEKTAPLTNDRDLDWQTAVDDSLPAECVPVTGADPLYILYTSGTTGKPKGVVRDNGGHAVALKYSMSAVYNVEPGDVYWAASDIGWVVGHSYIVYAPLLHGCTTILYEGKPVRTPDAGAFWRVIEQHQVKTLFAAPTAFRAIIKEDPEATELEKYDISSLKSAFLAGERLDPPTYHWLVDKLGTPVIDHWWQTETGWAIAANLTGIEAMPTKAGSSTVPVPGFDVSICDDDGNKVPTGVCGNIVIKRPLPPSCLPTLWRDQANFEQTYLADFPGYYFSNDYGYFDEDGYLFIMGRTDDVINVAGHRLSTGTMEEVVAAHPAVAECAVIGIEDELKGQLPIGLVLLKDTADIDEETLQKELVAAVREKIGAIACFKQALLVKQLPKTRSGKILRKILRKIANGEEYIIPSTIDDPASLKEIETVMVEHGVIK